MAPRVTKAREAPPNRLEGWLSRTVQAGVLKSLPRYFPLRERHAQCPDQYARTLLENLRDTSGDLRLLEQVRDDTRAFRSWTESVLPVALLVGHRPGTVYTVNLMNGN